MLAELKLVRVYSHHVCLMCFHTVLHSCNQPLEIIVAWHSQLLPACDIVEEGGALTWSIQESKIPYLKHRAITFIDPIRSRTLRREGYKPLSVSAPTPCRLISTVADGNPATTSSIYPWLVPVPLLLNSESLYQSFLISSPVKAFAVWWQPESSIQQHDTALIMA